MSAKNQDTSMVYVVSLNSGKAYKSVLTWIDIVVQKQLYFYTFGKKRWPANPPNYFGFRYAGKLQSVHHVDKFSVEEDLSKSIPELGPAKRLKGYGDYPYALHKLGPAIHLPHTIKNGNIFGNGHLWIALDLLLSCKTVEEAHKKTKQRNAKVK